MLTLPPDFTFVIQFVTFFVLLAILGRLLFAPFLELLAERAARTSGDIVSAAASRAEVEALSARVDAELAKAHSAANAEVEAVRAKTREEVAELYRSAQNAAAVRLADLREQVTAATRQARSSLAGDSRTMADSMVAAVLGGAGSR